MSKQRGLGRGLGALLGDPILEPEQDSKSTQQVSLQKVEPNPLQPRRAFDEEALAQLADSIAQHGVIQPLTVREMDGGFYQIIAGERRWRAARMAGLSEIPVVVLNVDDKTAMELALIENLQRQDLNPMEEARGYQSLMQDYALTQEQVAEQVGKSRSAVANALRLLGLSESVQDLLEKGTLSAGHARAILTLKDPQAQKAAAQRIINLELSVRQAESLCKTLSREPKAKPEPAPLEVNYLAECEKHLSKTLGRGVKITNGKRKGKFELEFYGQEDLQRLIDALETMHLSTEESYD